MWRCAGSLCRIARASRCSEPKRAVAKLRGSTARAAVAQAPLMQTRSVPELLEAPYVDDARDCVVSKTPAAGISVSFEAAREQALGISAHDHGADSGHVHLGVSRAEAELLWQAGARRD